MPEPTEQHFELTDVEIDTLGLVSRGANREDFFLLKADNSTSTEQVADVSDSVWKKIAAVIKRAFTMELEEEEGSIAPQDAEPTSKDEGAEPVIETVVTEPAADATEAATDNTVAKETDEPVAEESTVEPAAEPTQKESPMEDTNPTPEYVSKSDHDAVRAPSVE